jgi:hypothetical protein
VNLPKADIVGDNAFEGCTALATLYLGAIPPQQGGQDVFKDTGTGAGTGTTLTIKVPTAAAVNAYESAWGVSVSTAANGDTAKYGNDHKAITIAAAP